MQQHIYLKLDPIAQEWVINAWGLEVTKKNMLGIIIGPYIDYVPKNENPGFKHMVGNPSYLCLELMSKFNEKDIRFGVYVPGKHHHSIELAIKDAMRIEFLRYMEYCSHISTTTKKDLIDLFIKNNKLPCDKLDAEYFRKLYYNNRISDFSPKNGAYAQSIGFG